MLGTIGLALAHRVFSTVSGWLRDGASGIDDPAGLPTLAAILVVFTLATTPLVDTAERTVELDADRFGLELAHEPDGMARALIATGDYRASSPGPVEEAIFYDHPSIAHRVRIAMDWKAAHLPAATRHSPHPHLGS